MAGKKEILGKLKILITQKFDSAEDAFSFFDKNGDQKLNKSELVDLIKNAEINGFIAAMVAKKLLSEMDEDDDRKFSWREFKKAVKKLMDE